MDALRETSNQQPPPTTRVVCAPGSAPPGGRRRRGGRGGRGAGTGGGGGDSSEPAVTVTLSSGAVLKRGGADGKPEVCRNYLAGRCQNANCKRLHEPAGVPQAAKPDGGKGSGKERRAKEAADAAKPDAGKGSRNKDAGKAATAAKGSALRPRLVKGGNTKSFKPSFSPPDMRVVIGPRGETFGRTYGVHDVVMVPELFCDANDMSVYDNLLKEIKAAGQDSLWASWHGDSHMIADDKRMGGKWKDMSPTFLAVVEKIRTYFNMDIQATRFNWYRDASDWKPYHHDAAAMKAHMATKQNITIAASFGAERDVSFMVRSVAPLTHALRL